MGQVEWPLPFLSIQSTFLRSRPRGTVRKVQIVALNYPCGWSLYMTAALVQWVRTAAFKSIGRLTDVNSSYIGRRDQLSGNSVEG